MRTKMILATLIALAAALLSACSTDPSDDHNDADVAFASEMIPHHRQATEMAGLAASRTENPDVLDLADEIAAAQEPEIATMSGWLESWDEDVPGDMGAMGGEMASMPGMMSDDQMTQLRDASGAAFDELFLTMMVEHHEGAIEMAQAEQADGEFADATALAGDIERTQTAEIDRMRDLLAGR